MTQESSLASQLRGQGYLSFFLDGGVQWRARAPSSVLGPMLQEHAQLSRDTLTDWTRDPPFVRDPIRAVHVGCPEWHTV